MNKNEAEKKIKKLREEINLHNYRYYVENNPVISDYEFDQLLKKLEKLESDFPELITPESPTQRISEQPSEGFETVEHKVPMLSLANTYTFDELREFDERIKKHVSDVEYVVWVAPDVGIVKCDYCSDSHYPNQAETKTYSLKNYSLR